MLEVAQAITVSYRPAQPSVACVTFDDGDTLDLVLEVLSSVGLQNFRLTAKRVSDESPAAIPAPVAAGTRVVFPAIAVPQPGVYALVVQSEMSVCSGCRTREATLRFAARRSGPLLLFQMLGNFFERASDTSVVTVTIQLRNAGVGVIDLELSPSSADWSVSPASISLVGPSASFEDQKTRSATLTAAPRAAGVHIDTLRLSGVPADSMHPHFSDGIPLRTAITESASHRIDLPGFFAAIGADGKDGLLLLRHASDTLYAADAVTGVLTVVGTGMPCCYFDRIVPGPDSSWYFSAFEPGRTSSVYRRSRSGGVDLIANDVAPGFTVLPDGSIYGSTHSESELVRISPTGTREFVQAPGSQNSKGVLFNPLDSALYYVTDSTLRKRELKTGIDRSLGILSGSPPLLGVDAQGYMYAVLQAFAGMSASHLVVIDTAGRVVDRRWPASYAEKLAVTGNRIHTLLGWAGQISSLTTRTPSQQN